MMRLVKTLSPKQLEWRNCPETMVFLRQSELISEEEQKIWLEGLIGDKTRQMFGVEVQEDHERPQIVGTAGLTSITERPRLQAEWSLLIGPEHRGKGYGRSALKLLLEYGFMNLGLRRIEGEIFEGNQASLRLAEFYGFKKEGIKRESYFKNGVWINSVMVGLLRREWDSFQSL